MAFFRSIIALSASSLELSPKSIVVYCHARPCQVWLMFPRNCHRWLGRVKYPQVHPIWCWLYKAGFFAFWLTRHSPGLHWCLFYCYGIYFHLYSNPGVENNWISTSMPGHVSQIVRSYAINCTVRVTMIAKCCVWVNRPIATWGALWYGLSFQSQQAK